jgi:hypothetical protein
VKRAQHEYTLLPSPLSPPSREFLQERRASEVTAAAPGFASRSAPEAPAVMGKENVAKHVAHTRMWEHARPLRAFVAWILRWQ